MRRDVVHVVVGATGATGVAVVRELLRRGEKVRAVSRRGGTPDPAAEAVAADATDPARMREVCAGATAVHCCVNPPFLTWRTAFPDVIRSLITAAGSTDAVLAFADDTWMYGKVTGPMREDTPVRPVSELGVLRAWLAEMVMAAHARGDVRAVIARGGELYGPLVESVLGQNLFGRAAGGRKPVWMGDPDLPVTPTYIEDFARGLVTVAMDPTAWGQVWHSPNGPATTGREFVREVCSQAGRPNALWNLTRGMTGPLKVLSATARHGVDAILYQFEQPFIVDSSRFDRHYEEQATPYAEGIARTLAWYRESPERTRAGMLPKG